MAQPPYFFSPFEIDSRLPLLIFLPGMDETGKELMTLQTASFKGVFDVRCLVIPKDALESWDALSQQTIALTRAELGQPRQVYLCGESFGGCIALDLLKFAPELFDRIVLVNPASSFHRQPLLNFGSRLLVWTPQFIYNLLARLTLPFLARIARLSPPARAALSQATRAAPKHTAEQRLQLLREFRIDRSKLQQFTQLVLLIGSRKDRILPSVAEVKRLAQIFPNAQIFTLPESGHACLVETDLNVTAILQAHGL